MKRSLLAGWRLISEFLFPQTREALALEELSAGELIALLPPSEKTTGKHILTVFDYEHPLVRSVVHEFKYHGNLKLGNILGEILYDVIVSELAGISRFAQTRLLIPIPASRKRLLERGWNQTEILCREITRRDQAKILEYLPFALAKNRHTPTQVEVHSADARRQNLLNSMTVNRPDLVRGKSIILIDDVTTTGSTFNEARRALLKSGAGKIFCVAIAG